VGSQSGQSVLAHPDEARPSGLGRRATGTTGRIAARHPPGWTRATAYLPQRLHARLSARRIGGGVALGGTRGRDHPGRERPGGAQRGRRAQAVNRAVALFVGACVAALVIGHLLRDTPGYMVRNPDGTIT